MHLLCTVCPQLRPNITARPHRYRYDRYPGSKGVPLLELVHAGPPARLLVPHSATALPSASPHLPYPSSTCPRSIRLRHSSTLPAPHDSTAHRRNGAYLTAVKNPRHVIFS